MTSRSYAEESSTSRTHDRVRFELILGSTLLAAGLSIVPASVYWMGLMLLGPYGDGTGGGGLGDFFAGFFADLASGSGRAWTLVLGPLILVSIVRLVFMRRSDEPADEEDRPARPPAARPKAKTETAARRVEPRVSLDH